MEPVTLSGTVTRFKGNGRKLGYPTANLVSETTLADGVYFGFCDLSQYVQHPCIIFVGIPTTVGDTERRVEVHLLDIPDIDYYDQPLSVSINKYHRANQTFDSIDTLKKAMKNDEITARKWFTDVK